MKSWSVFAEGRGSGRREGLTWAMRKHLGMVIGSLSWLRWYFLKCIHMSKFIWLYVKFQFSSVGQSCLTLCDRMDLSTPGFPVHYQLPELAKTYVHQVGDATQPSHPLSSPSPPAFNLSQHQSLFKWVSSLHNVAKRLELQLQHQSLQWIFRTDFL